AEPQNKIKSQARLVYKTEETSDAQDRRTSKQNQEPSWNSTNSCRNALYAVLTRTAPPDFFTGRGGRSEGDFWVFGRAPSPIGGPKSTAPSRSERVLAQCCNQRTSLIHRAPRSSNGNSRRTTPNKQIPPF